jgi:5-methylthioadenosine/S-adenosylhomocysteine deaminase
VGALRVGWKADLILVDLDRVLEDPWCTPDLSIAEAFIHRASGRDVATVVVGGTVVVENRKARTIDVPALYREIRKAARGISADQRRHAEMLQRIKPYYQDWYDAWLPADPDPFYVLNSRT